MSSAFGGAVGKIAEGDEEQKMVDESLTELEPFVNSIEGSVLSTHPAPPGFAFVDDISQENLVSSSGRPLVQSSVDNRCSSA